MKRLIIFLHRYLGIPMSVMFIVWFVSGIFMMYTGDMPSLGESARLRGLGTIDLAAVNLSPAEAAREAGIEGALTDATLQPLLGRPAYRFGRGFGWLSTVYADNGEVFDGASAEQARTATAAFVDEPIDAVRFVETVTEPDQWTMTESANLPLERFDVDDGHGTRVYFSRSAGEVKLVTDRKTRALAWLGAIPHWLYFSSLRLKQRAWYRTVVGLSVLGCALATLGLVLAVTQFRRSKPFRLSASVRYRGLMKWHYYTGALFGVFALTWVFSGLMSMEPFPWNGRPGLVFRRTGLEGGPLELEQYRIGDPAFAAAVAGEPVYEIELARLQTRPYFIVRSAPSGAPAARKVIDAETLQPRTEPFSADSILAIVEEATADANVREHDVLDDYDAYYYSQNGQAPLPALRVKFDDPADTWYYFDLATSTTVAAYHRLDRLQRWLFNGLHRLDFGFWYRARPLWDIVMIVLSLGALSTSSIGMYLGFKRLFGRPRRGERPATSSS